MRGSIRLKIYQLVTVFFFSFSSFIYANLSWNIEYQNKSDYTVSIKEVNSKCFTSPVFWNTATIAPHSSLTINAEQGTSNYCAGFINVPGEYHFLQLQTTIHDDSNNSIKSSYVNYIGNFDNTTYYPLLSLSSDDAGLSRISSRRLGCMFYQSYTYKAIGKVIFDKDLNIIPILDSLTEDCLNK